MKPEWIRMRPPSGEKFLLLKKTIEELKLNTVCMSASCPNMGVCWSHGTATFMIMGSVCTRSCRFCSVEKGKEGERLDPSEPERIAKAAGKLGLEYVVLTSVDRDDLPDGGASHFARCIRALKTLDENIRIEALIPDFQGDEACLKIIIDSHPDIVGHNIETVKELQSYIRDKRAGYALSMDVLRKVKHLYPRISTKSSLMLGFGETERMVLQTMDDLRSVGVNILTIGQYLRPTWKQLEVKEYISPEKYAYYKKRACEKGFLKVDSGPLIRSSYGVFSKD